MNARMKLILSLAALLSVGRGYGMDEQINTLPDELSSDKLVRLSDIWEEENQVILEQTEIELIVQEEDEHRSLWDKTPEAWWKWKARPHSLEAEFERLEAVYNKLETLNDRREECLRIHEMKVRRELEKVRSKLPDENNKASLTNQKSALGNSLETEMRELNLSLLKLLQGQAQEIAEAQEEARQSRDQLGVLRTNTHRRQTCDREYLEIYQKQKNLRSPTEKTMKNRLIGMVTAAIIMVGILKYGPTLKRKLSAMYRKIKNSFGKQSDEQAAPETDTQVPLIGEQKS